MSTESDSNNSESSSSVREGDVTQELTSRKRVYSQANLNVGILRSDSEESSCSEMDLDMKMILNKFSYYADVEEVKAIWLRTLERAETTGTALLLAFVVGSTGCPYVFLEESDYLNITSVEKFENAMRDAGFSKRKCQLNRILEFINHTFNEKILLGKFIMKEFVSFMLLMSGSHFKNFRMVAICAGTAVMSLLLKLEVKLESQISGLEKILNSDRSLTDSDMNNMRICELKEKLSSTTYHFSLLFEKLCHQCHRDVETDIRLCVISTLTIWLMDYPQKIVNDNYLCYFVWMLCDPSAKVRLRAIKACIGLFKNTSKKNKLQIFVLKSKPYIMKMISDVSPIVAEAALRCLCFIYMNYSVLKNEECEQIYFKVYSIKAKIAEAAGSFVLQKIAEGAQSQMIMLNDLARFHYESGVKGCEDYFVSALINNATFFMNWKLWTKAILFTTNVSIQPVLCQMLISVIKLISNNEQFLLKKMKMFSFFSQEKYVALKKRFRADQFHEVNLQKMTLHFAHMLPQLIQHFQFNDKCLAPLIQIPQHFDYSYTVDLRHTVEPLYQVFMTSTNSLKEIYSCCSIITILENSQHREVITKCRRFVQLFCERHFKDAVMTVVENKLDLRNEDLVQKVQLIIRKTLILTSFHNLCSTSVWPFAFQGLQVVSDSQELASDDVSLILKLLSSICFGNIFTRVDEMFLTVENNGSVHEEDMKSLSRYTFAYIEILIVLLKKITCTEVVETAFIAMCSILLAFSKYNVKLVKLRRLVILPSPVCLELVSVVLQILVPFSDHDQNSMKLYRQQRCLNKYCTLLESGTFKIEYLCNVLSYLKNEGLQEIAGETLCTLFRKNAVDTSRVIISFLSYSFSISKEQGTDTVCFAEIIANTLSAGIKKKTQIAFRLHIAAFRYIRTYNCFDILKVIVGFAKLLNKNKLPYLRRLVELFFGHMVPVSVHDYLDSVHQVVRITGYARRKGGYSVNHEITKKRKLIFFTNIQQP